ncbi:unnamed protein product [Adineta steineri]|uniref:Kinesin light chain n=1 Tax=Adineta steineri TaxID=433720 RepID=A0A815QY51_9BILA|nr:unnamed protein product [Adineta steineri]
MGGSQTREVEQEEILNLETYSLIWLDETVNKLRENLQGQQRLRASINRLLTFEDYQLCLQCIQSLSRYDRIIIIVNGQLGKQHIPQIASIQQIISIYIYDTDKQNTERWTQNFSKIKGVFDRLNELINRIQTDQTHRQHHRVDEPLSIQIVNTNLNETGQSSSELNGQFVHNQLLIDCFIRMEPSLNEKQALITLCKQQYKNNPTELKIIEEFNKNYSSTQSIWWYTRQSFIYRLLNKALRVNDIDLLYLFRFFIRDLEKELKNNKCSLPVHVYRAQLMSIEEIEIFKKSIGCFISMNSFFSTSLNQEQARLYFNFVESSDYTQKVLFEIDADPRLDNIKPFANITQHSYFSNEEEILFMIGSIFKINEIKHDDNDDNNGIWNIQLVLCSNNDHQLQLLFQYMQDELGYGETSLYELGRVLCDMGKFSDSEIYFRLYLKQLMDENESLSSCYFALGKVTYMKGDYESSLMWYNKSLDIFMQTLDEYDPNIGQIYNAIAAVYYAQNDYHRGLESYEKALVIFEQAYGKDHVTVAMCLNNMGLIYQDEKKYSQALEFQQNALFIRQKHLPTDHPDLGTSYNNIGIIYECTGQYDLALKYLNLSLEISKKSLPPQHPEIATTYENISLIYENNGDLQQALSYTEKAAAIYHHSLPSTHSCVITVQKNIERILSKLQ